MKLNSIRKFLAMSLAVATLTVLDGKAASLVIDSVKSQTVGTTAVIPQNTSGDASNTTFWNTGVVGQFVVGDSNSNLYGLRVSATNPTGKLVSGTDSLMVARTVDSQGLKDTGTLSVYVRMTGTNTANNAPTTDGRWTLDLNFSFFNVTPDGGGGYNFTTPHSLGLQLTSLDIDFNQRYYTSATSFSSNITYAPTKIVAAPAISGFAGFTAAGDSQFNNPAHAVSSKGTGSSFDVRLSHDRVALYMFEFRDPSNIIPEPSTVTLTLMAGFVVVGFFRRMRSVS